MRGNNLKTIFLSAALLCFLNAFSQGTLKHNQDEESVNKEKYFDDSKDETGSQWQNVIKINPFSLLNGELPIFYERNFNGGLSIEAGIGPTFRNYLFDYFHYSHDIDEYFAHTTVKSGLTLKGEIRYYTNGGSDFPKGSYVAFSVRYKNHKLNFYDAKPYTSSYINTIKSSFEMENTFTDVVFLYGYQDQIAGNVYLDSYIGLGVRKKTTQDFEEAQDATYSYTYYQPTTTNSTVVLFTLGIKLSFAF